VAQVVKTGDGADTERYVHDANNNVIEQTIKNSTTTFNYNRNRLLTGTTGTSTASYNYDPFGRLDTVTSGGQVIERNVYDGFDRIIENRKLGSGGAMATTKYTFDPMDRTTSKTTDVGTPKEKTTVFNYLGLTKEVLDEEVAGRVTKSYQYSPWGERLSQVKHNDDGTEEDAYYGYDRHTDVEQITDRAGDTKATYDYTAYGRNDDALFTGIDKPDAQDPTKEPYNAYRFNAKRWDSNAQSLDMGFRDYSPGLNRFLTRDSYNGALADMKLNLDPWTGSRYAFAGGNPITNVEVDGHFWDDIIDFVRDVGEAVQTAGDAVAKAAEGDDPGIGSGANSDDGFTGGSMGANQVAWCASVGALKCAIAHELKQQAIDKVNELAGKYQWSRGRRNAFRHSYWMGLMTLYGFSYDEAIALGEAHENDTDTPGELPGSPDSNADLHNNGVGARIGVDIRPWYVYVSGVGTTDEHEAELERRLFNLVGGPISGKLEEPIVTDDGSLEFIEPN
jgi:RHS repeat-associated protein